MSITDVVLWLIVAPFILALWMAVGALGFVAWLYVRAVRDEQRHQKFARDVQEAMVRQQQEQWRKTG